MKYSLIANIANIFTKSQIQMKNVKYSEIEKRPASGNHSFPEFDEYLGHRTLVQEFAVVDFGPLHVALD